MTDDSLNVEVFATGHWAGLDWTTDDLDQMAANFERTKAFIKPPVKLGHSNNQILAGQDDGDPALGWVSGLQRHGSKLVATITGVPPVLKDIVAKGGYKRVSSEIYPRFEQTNAERNVKTGATGKVLSAVAFLGANPPEVKSLADLGNLFGVPVKLSERDPDCIECSLTVAPAAVRSKDPIQETRAALESAFNESQRRLDAVKAERAVLRFKNEQLREDYEKTMTKVLLTAFDPSVADRVGPRAHTAMAGTEAHIRRHRLDRTAPPARAKALSAWMTANPSEARGLTADDMSAVVTGFARSPSPDSWDAASPLRNHAPGPKSQNSALPRHHVAGDDLLRLRELSPTAMMPTMDASELARKLGGGARLTTFLSLCKEHSWNPALPSHFAAAEQALYDGLGSTTATALTYSECAYAVQKRDKCDARTAALTVARERPDLIEGHNRRSPEPDEPMKLSESEKATRFETALHAELLKMNEYDPFSTDNRRQAALRVAALHPELVPTYSRGKGW